MIRVYAPIITATANRVRYSILSSLFSSWENHPWRCCRLNWRFWLCAARTGMPPTITTTTNLAVFVMGPNRQHTADVHRSRLRIMREFQQWKRCRHFIPFATQNTDTEQSLLLTHCDSLCINCATESRDDDAERLLPACILPNEQRPSSESKTLNSKFEFAKYGVRDYPSEAESSSSANRAGCG